MKATTGFLLADEFLEQAADLLDLGEPGLQVLHAQQHALDALVLGRPLQVVPEVVDGDARRWTCRESGGRRLGQMGRPGRSSGRLFRDIGFLVELQVDEPAR